MVTLHPWPQRVKVWIFLCTHSDAELPPCVILEEELVWNHAHSRIILTAKTVYFNIFLIKGYNNSRWGKNLLLQIFKKSMSFTIMPLTEEVQTRAHELLTQFFSAISESLLRTSITVGFSWGTKSDIRWLRWMAGTAEQIINALQPTPEDLHFTKIRKRAEKNPIRALPLYSRARASRHFSRCFTTDHAPHEQWSILKGSSKFVKYNDLKCKNIRCIY